MCRSLVIVAVIAGLSVSGCSGSDAQTSTPAPAVAETAGGEGLSSALSKRLGSRTKRIEAITCHRFRRSRYRVHVPPGYAVRAPDRFCEVRAPHHSTQWIARRIHG